MRRYMAWSSALWCVTNGLALAPPGIGCSMGVSTSMKPLAIMKARMEPSASLRARKRLRAASSVIRSTYRWRYLTSWSVMPWNLSGSGRSDLVSRRSLVTRTVSSPARVMNSVPSAARMSPRSQCLNWS